MVAKVFFTSPPASVVEGLFKPFISVPTQGEALTLTTDGLYIHVRMRMFTWTFSTIQEHYVQIFSGVFFRFHSSDGGA